MRIVFMGTPEIAASALMRLYEGGENIVGVITGEDKPRGRGHIMTPTAVKAYAESRGIPVYTPKTLRTEEFLAVLGELSPELIVVVAYGKILPREVLEYPKYGCINMHVSLLPKYRGAAPMQRAIMAGEKITGVTVMQMAEGLDTGDIVSSESFPIGAEDDFEAIHDRSAEIGAELLLNTVRDIAAGRATRTPQNDAEASYANKIEKSDCKIDFTKSAKELDFIIRGVTPIPGAYAYLRGKMLKINKARPVDKKGKPGEVIELNSEREGEITVACGEGALSILRVIPEGKGAMSAGDLIRGRKIEIGDILS